MKTAFIFFSLLFLWICLPGSLAQKRVSVPDDRKVDAGEFRRVQPGIELGFNIESLHADWTGETTLRIGAHLGFNLHIRFSKIIGFQPGLQLSTQGLNFSSGNSYNLFYLNVPVILKINVYKGFYLNAGPMLGVRFYARYWDNVEKENIKAYIKPYDLALRFGSNYQFGFGLSISLHYNIGLTNISDYGNRDEFSIKNRFLQFGTGYYF